MTPSPPILLTEFSLTLEFVPPTLFFFSLLILQSARKKVSFFFFPSLFCPDYMIKGPLSSGSGEQEEEEFSIFFSVPPFAYLPLHELHKLSLFPLAAFSILGFFFPFFFMKKMCFPFFFYLVLRKNIAPFEAELIFLLVNFVIFVSDLSEMGRKQKKKICAQRPIFFLPCCNQHIFFFLQTS